MDRNIHVAQKYLLNAGAFRNAISLVLADESARNYSPNLATPVVCYLASHVLELHLKAALLKRGVAEEVLRTRKYGHNLSVLADELSKLVAISDSTIRLIATLSQQHNDHSLRYEGEGLIVDKDWLESGIVETVQLCATGMQNLRVESAS